jgi:hypothetical protein
MTALKQPLGHVHAHSAQTNYYYPHPVPPFIGLKKLRKMV